MYLCPAVRLANLILVFLEDLSGDGLFDVLRDGAGSAISCRPWRLYFAAAAWAAALSKNTLLPIDLAEVSYIELQASLR